jgi:2-polyprenyl-3-methyl-5-hydroxy-6-metoxy-1,4-benzoquinol methylase
MGLFMRETRDQIIERYHTYTRRPVLTDASIRKVLFKSYRRILGPWLPEDRCAHILDIGCGEGALLAFLQEQGYLNLSGFDLSPENVGCCHEVGLRFVRQFDALRLTEFSGPVSYDVIFCMDVLEHIPKPQVLQFLLNVNERLKSGGGYVIFQTPNMGNILGMYHRYSDLTHEFCLTEKSAVDLLLASGFQREQIAVRPSWNATTVFGYLREVYLQGIHWLVFITEGHGRPRIPTKNLLIRAGR